MKMLWMLGACLGFSLSLSATIFGMTSPPVDEIWALEHLVSAPREKTSELIVEFEKKLETAPQNETAQLHLALGILHVHRYIWFDKRRDSVQAHDHLMSLGGELATSPLALAYKGMSSSFLAKRRTIFGVGDLKDMRAYFEKIPTDHPSWFVRFLRGTTLYEVGEALPGIWPLKEHKKAAQELGARDLKYVLEQYNKNPVKEFARKHYSATVSPVPRVIKDKILKVLPKDSPLVAEAIGTEARH